MSMMRALGAGALSTVMVLAGVTGTATAGGDSGAAPRADGDTDLTFDDTPVGDYLTTQYQARGVVFGGDRPFVAMDDAAPHNPVVSGEPLFKGIIEVRFVMPDGSQRTVDHFSVDVGWVNTPGTVQVAVLGLDGTALQVVPIERVGYIPVPVTGKGIAAFRVSASPTSVDEAGFTIDDVTFAPPPSAFPAAPPTGVSVTASPGQAWITWTPAPPPDAGPLVTSFAVQQSTDAGVTWTTTVGSPTVNPWLRVNGLANGTPVQFRVAGVNSFGPGPFSAATTAVTPQGPGVLPGPVTALTATSPSRGRAAVAWGAPATGTAPTSYRYRVRKGAGPYGPWTAVAPAVRRVALSGLTSRVRYSFAVLAANTTGSGPARTVSVTVR